MSRTSRLWGIKMCTSNTFSWSCLTIRFLCVLAMPISVQPIKEESSVRDWAHKQVSDFAEWFIRILAKLIRFTQVLLVSAEFLSSQSKGTLSASALHFPPAWLYLLMGWLTISLKMDKTTTSITAGEKVKWRWHVGPFHHPETRHPVLEQNRE